MTASSETESSSAIGTGWAASGPSAPVLIAPTPPASAILAMSMLNVEGVGA